VLVGSAGTPLHRKNPGIHFRNRYHCGLSKRAARGNRDKFADRATKCGGGKPS
jgi:hypothetical protein